MNNDYISHHGILGMHWGYRKADNVDTNKDSFLSSKGYGAVLDDADAGLISDTPIIIFDRGKSLEAVKFHKVNRDYLKSLGKDRTNDSTIIKLK